MTREQAEVELAQYTVPYRVPDGCPGEAWRTRNPWVIPSPTCAVWTYRGWRIWRSSGAQAYAAQVNWNRAMTKMWAKDPDWRTAPLPRRASHTMGCDREGHPDRYITATYALLKTNGRVYRDFRAACARAKGTNHA